MLISFSFLCIGTSRPIKLLHLVKILASDCIFLFLYREAYGDFLVRLETCHNVSQRAVQEISSEILQFSSRVLKYCAETVSEHLGN
jgi:hypothetical protein